MAISAASKQETRRSWQSYAVHARAALARLSRGVMIVTWLWVALKAAVGDEAGTSEDVLSGPLLVAGILCLVGLLLLGGTSKAPLRPSRQLRRRQLRRRRGSRIVADRRQNGRPTYYTPAPQRQFLNVQGERLGRGQRAAMTVKSGIGRHAGGKRRGRIVA